MADNKYITFDGCPEDYELVDEIQKSLLTQYRESPNLILLLRTYLREVEKIYQIACGLPDLFNLETAVGEQLTFIGKRMGFGRKHCICSVKSIHGFDDQIICNNDNPFYTYTGFCASASNWLFCDDNIVDEIEITDDEVYRKCLRIRSYQITNKFGREDLIDAAGIFFGENTTILDDRNGRIVITPGRVITNDEFGLLQVLARILPVVPGIKILFYLDTNPVTGMLSAPAGFGDGWSGFCETTIDDAPLITGDGDNLVTDGGDNLIASGIVFHAHWVCGFDPRPYSCSTN